MFSTNNLMGETDLVVVIGSQLSDQTTLNWSAPDSITPIIQIDIAGEELGRSYPNCIGLQGDAKTVVSQLLKITSETERSEWTAKARALTDETLAAQADALCEH